MAKKSVFKNTVKVKKLKRTGEIPPAPTTRVTYHVDGSIRPDRGRSDDHLFENDFSEDDLFEAVDDEG